MYIFIDKLFNSNPVDDNQKKIIKLRNLFYIYSKYLNEKKFLYFSKYRSIVDKMPLYQCTCICTCPYQNIITEYDSIPLYKKSYHKNVNYNYISKNNNNNNNKNSAFSQNVCNTNENKDYFSNSRDSQNKSAFCDYINLNKSNYYYNGNNNGNYSSYQIYYDNNNINNDNKIINNKNNYKDKKYIVKIKLSNNHGCTPNFYDNNYTVNNRNSSIVEYSNNIVNNSNNYIEERSRRRHCSYKNLTLPYQLNNNQSGIKNNYSSYSSYNIFKSPYKNDQKEIITERIYNRDYKNSLHSNKENDPNDNNKISDQQIQIMMKKKI